MESPFDNIDQHLKSLPVEGGFTVPEGYFDDLKVLVYYQTVYPAEPERSAAVSETYFAEARQQILANTVHSQSQKVFKLSTVIKYVAVAASLILVAGMTFWLSTTQSSQQLQLTNEEIIGYLEQDAMREVAVDEMAKVVPVNEITVDTDEEDYLILETL